MEWQICAIFAIFLEFPKLYYILLCFLIVLHYKWNYFKFCWKTPVCFDPSNESVEEPGGERHKRSPRAAQCRWKLYQSSANKHVPPGAKSPVTRSSSQSLHGVITNCFPCCLLGNLLAMHLLLPTGSGSHHGPVPEPLRYWLSRLSNFSLQFPLQIFS